MSEARSSGTWSPDAEPVDVVLFSGMPTPGVAEIVGLAKRKWDQISSAGMSGAVSIYHGRELSSFQVKLTLIGESDWVAFWVFKAKVLDIVPKVAVGSAARNSLGVFDVTHPILNTISVTAAVVESHSAPEQVADGVWLVTISCLEWRPLKIAISKPDGSAAAPAASAELVTARARAEARIRDKRELLDHLATDPQP
jgi:hypothetical protein